MCYQYHIEKTNLKKFFKGNNIDPKVVSKELKKFMKIKEILITQVFTIMTIYQLREKQTVIREML